MKNILVVDDNQDVANLLKLMLQLAGHNAVVVNSGKECLNMLYSNKFDLVLLDIAMPGITGVDVFNKVRTDPALTHNKIVFITASSPTEEAMESLMEQGALEIAKKPITEEKLLEIITKYA